MRENMTIRRFEPRDLAAVQEMMCGGICEADCRGCSSGENEKKTADFSTDFLQYHARQSHFYLAECADGTVAGAAAITSLHNRQNESVIAFLYRHCNFEAEWINPLLLTALEEDEFFLSADRVEVFAAPKAVSFFEKMGYSEAEKSSCSATCGVAALEKLLIPDWEALAALRQKTAYELIDRLGIEKAWSSIGGEAHLTGALPAGLLLKTQEIEFTVLSEHLDIAESLAVISRFAADSALLQMEYRIGCTLKEEFYYEFKLTVMHDQKEWIIAMRQIPRGSSLENQAETLVRRLKETLTPEMVSTILMLKFFTQDQPSICHEEYCCAVVKDGVCSCEGFLAWRKWHALPKWEPWCP